MSDHRFDRRRFVRLMAAGIAVGGATLMQACSPSTPSAPATAAPSNPTQPAAKPTTSSAAATSAPAAAAPAAPTTAAAAKPAATTGVSRTVQLPNRFPLTGIKPDLPASADGLIDAAFVNYPADPPKTVQETPGRGGEVNVVTWTTSAAPTPLDSNALWQAVNKDLGVDLKINIQPQADYATLKLPTLIAGGELPDILYIATNAVIPQFPTLLKSKCADLTPYLSGDAVKEYPNLANFPTLAWKQVIYNNAIYGVPVPYPLYLWVHWVHQNLLDDEGLSRPKNAVEYKNLGQHFTRPDQNLWGMGSENNVGMGVTNGWLSGVFGMPNIWSLDDKTGKLTAHVETEQFRAAVSYAKDLWNAGIFHPNAMQYNLVSARNDFAARRFAFRFDGFQSASITFWENASNLDPPGKPRIMAPFPAVDGGKPTYWPSMPAGILGFSVIKQASPDRIKEMLRILNWLAAPMGSQEYRLMNYGLKDTHWSPDEKGNPILNARGKADALVPFRYITQGPVALYYTRDPQYAQVMQDAEKTMLPFVAMNPTEGYYSPTKDSKYPAIAQRLFENVNDVVLGRQPFSNLDQVTKEWLDNGGNQMRMEFEREIAASRG
jgi:putative aldouronate transport system substrate-binding protein